MPLKSFLKENPLWLSVIAACLLFTGVYGVWCVGHPRITYVTGEGPAVPAQIVPRGEKTLPPLPGELSHDGLTLEGWYADPDLTEPYSGEALTRSRTVYAKWKPEEFTVTYRAETGKLRGQTVYSVDYGETLAPIEAPSAESGSLYFTGWYTDPELTTPFKPGVTRIYADTELWASFGYPTDRIDGLNAPVLFIDASGSVSKGSYTDCTVSVVSEQQKYNRTELGAQIRGRGNSTWNYEKKPYRIKFDEKLNLFGMGAAKDWILLANTVDMSMLRNYTVYKIAQEFTGCRYTTDCQFVHVYLNGDYRGLYLLTEQVETGKNRVDIGDGTDENGKILPPEECGYLLECGQGGANGNQAVFYPRSSGGVSTDHVVVKSPDGSLLTAKHIQYITNYYNDVQKAIGNDDFDTLCSLADLDSLVDSFICTELILSGDGGWVFFAYKEPGGKLFLGPLWDYDQSAGVSEHGGAGYTGYTMATPHTWYDRLITNSAFREAVKESWNAHIETLHAIPERCYSVAEAYRRDIDLNYTRWEGFLGSRQWRSLPQVDALKTYPEHVDYFVEWIENRMAWIEKDLGIEEN